jgi:putative transcriptional regulator
VSPAHHPSPDILAEYAAGAMEAGFALVVAAHAEGCAACRARIAAYEDASGAALAELPQAEIAPDALARAMARLGGAPAAAEKVDTRPFLQRLPLKPKRWAAPGVWVAAVDTPHAPENRVYLLSVARGGLTARHQHSGAEFCTVLKGAYRDELGVFGPGDFAAAYGDFNHQPVVHGDEACLCLFATEGRLKPQGFFAGLAFAFADV